MLFPILPIVLAFFHIASLSPTEDIRVLRTKRQGFGNFDGGFSWGGGGSSSNTQSSSVQTTQPTPSTVAIPGMGTTRSACEDACQATTQFDPICGNNGVTYTNIQWLRCAQRCGRNVQIQYPGACPRK